MVDFPVGSLLLWNSDTHQEERVAKDGVTPALWIVDGQQRTTALAILFGRKPYWWGSADDWNKIQKRYDIRFDVAAKNESHFVVANAAIRKTLDKNATLASFSPQRPNCLAPSGWSITRMIIPYTNLKARTFSVL
jgi:hypothetical protein